MDLKQLEIHWVELWTRIGAQGNPLKVFKKVIERYSENHRKYHNLDHLIHCLETFYPIRSFFSNPDAAEFALWFHDIVYNPQSNYNEVSSALLAIDSLILSNVKVEFDVDVEKYIMATKHTSFELDFDTQLVCDIDLSPLGLSGIEFDKNTAKIRQEYSMYSKEEFVAGRAKFIEFFLARPSIFQTWYFKERYEKQAWENLVVSLCWLPIFPFDP